MATERMFIALTLPLPVRDTVAGLAQPLTGLTWTRTEQLHLTLRFLGDVSDEQQPRMLERLSTVHVEPFVLPIEGMGTFPPNRPPRIVFVGVGSGHPRLHQLRQRLDDAVLASGLPLDVRTFHPHHPRPRRRKAEPGRDALAAHAPRIRGSAVSGRGIRSIRE